ncbi:hypothetical protein NDU88_002934 [Pleurodeles waltl]|uniref:Uncharacterized protein n=1 Tax=Pleurodeles waltl TaxID=8319 RepID=A0AAV7QBC2_PLEWA|nr:hypothetical protein NDU88_002934 [Pleurodeles waltl]
MTGSRSASLGSLFVEFSFTSRGPAYLYGGVRPPRVFQPLLVCSRPNPLGPGSRCIVPVPPASIPPLGTAARRASSPQERGRRRVHSPTLTPGPRSVRTEETPSRLRMSLTSPGPPRKCTAGSGSPGAFVSRPHRNLVSLRLGPQGARASKHRAGVPSVLHRAAASAGEPLTSGSAERRSPGRHLEFIEPVAAGAFTAQICRRWFQGGISGVQEPMGIPQAAPVVWIVAAS